MATIRKKLVALALAATSLLQIPLVGSAIENYTKGDVNFDNRITVADALKALRYSVNIGNPNDMEFYAADVNNDDKITVVDALLIQRYAVNASSSLNPTDSTDTDFNGTDTDSDNGFTTPVNPDNNSDNGFGSNASEDTSIEVSGTSYSVPSGMTLYVTADTNVTWGSTNENVATVDNNGLVLAKNPGTVKIIALKGSSKRTITVTVTESEAVRTVYSSPNSAVTGSTVKFIATTDQSKSSVRFDVNINGAVTNVYATEKVADNEHGIYTWTGTMNVSTPGSFDVTAYSEVNGSWSTCDNAKTTMFVSSGTSMSVPSTDTRRASDDVIRLIADYEGGLEEAEYDPLAYGNVMNYGYGVVISAGEKFYNNANMNEYFADLVNQINENVYSKYVNSFLQENNVKYNQYQFDALVCFTYNLGVYSLQNAGLKSILLNCYEPTGTTTTSTTATVSVDDCLNLRSGAGTNYSVIGKLYNAQTVTVLDSERVNGVWVKVKAPDGTVGYCSADYLIFGGSSSGNVRNFNYINSNELIEELMAWHHAGGNCYWGLLYRRIDELELFLFGDYSQDGSANTNGWSYPDCIS